MSEHKRLHPLSIIITFLRIIRDTLWPFMIFLLSSVIQGDTDRLIWLLIGIPIVCVLAVCWAILSWWKFHYWVEEGVLKVKLGVILRNNKYIAQSRIQTMDEAQGLLQRLFNVVKLQVQTAGGQKPEVVLSAVSHKDAEFLRQALLDSPIEQLDETKSNVNDEYIPSVQEQKYRLSEGRLLIMAVTSGSIGVMLSFLIAGYSQLGNLFGDDHFISVVTDWLFSVPIVLTIIVILLVSWLLAVLGTILKYYGFTIRLSGEKLHINRGLLERRQVAIPRSRIQAIRIVESPIRQPFGWLSVYVESAGYGHGKGESTLLFPLLKRSELTEFIALMIPQFQVDYTLHRLPRRSLRKFITIHTIVALFISVPFLYFADWGYLALLIVPLSAAWGYAKYKEGGWNWDGSQRMLIIQSRFIVRRMVWIPKNRIQHFTISESPFQRKSQLATFRASVASSGQAGSSFMIKHISTEDSSLLMETLRVNDPR